MTEAAPRKRQEKPSGKAIIKKESEDIDSEEMETAENIWYRKWAFGIKLTGGEAYLLRRALETYLEGVKDAEFRKDIILLLGRVEALEARYDKVDEKIREESD